MPKYTVLSVDTEGERIVLAPVATGEEPTPTYNVRSTSKAKAGDIVEASQYDIESGEIDDVPVTVVEAKDDEVPEGTGVNPPPAEEKTSKKTKADDDTTKPAA